MLTGCFGAGKSWLLDKASTEIQAKNVLHLSLSLSRKAFIMAIVERLHTDGHDLKLDPDWTVAEKVVRKQTVEHLVERITPYISQYTYILDDLERATERTCKDVVEPLLTGVVLAAADISSKTQVKRISPVINHFNTIDIPPLTKAETTAMLWSLANRAQHKRPRFIETQVWNHSRGRPGVVADLIDKLGTSGTITDVRNLEHDAPGVPYVGLLPALLIVSVIALVVMRYTAHGFRDPYIYVFSASGYTALRVLMYPLQRWADG